MQLFPNPADLYINIRSSDWINNIQLIDMSGKILSVQTVAADFYQIDLSNLQAGFYFLNVNTEFGTKTLKFSKL